MKKGVVMDIGEGFLTLLTPEGEFLRARKQNIPYQIGEEIHFFPLENQNTSRTFTVKNLMKVKPIWMISVMAAFVIFFGSLIPIYHDNKAYAYMSIDVNPSIELGLNKKMQVVELTGFNKDGKKVISSLHGWKKKDVSQLTQTILKEMKKEGYLSNNKQVIISTVLTEDPGKKAKEELKENLNEIKETVIKQNLEVTIYNSNEKEREKAKKLGITTGKFHENHLDSSAAEKGKENHNQKNMVKEENNNSTETSDMPNGQIKEQNDVTSKSNEHSNHDGYDHNGTQMPPGQLKKNDEEHLKSNDGQFKKKADEEYKQNLNHGEGYIQNHDGENNHNHKHEENQKNQWQNKKQFSQKENDQHFYNHEDND